MSRKCDHDWFDHYMMYSMMSSKGGGGNIGCGPILTLIGLGLMVPIFEKFLLIRYDKKPKATNFLRLIVFGF